MKNVSNSLALRAAIAVTLSVSLTASARPSPSVSTAASSPASIDLRSQSQFRSEAANYDRALSELSKILNMKLETKGDLTQAHAIFEREHLNLRFLLSKLVVTALGDSAFTSGLMKKVTDQKSAEQFGKELGRDPNSIFTVSGAESLKTRMLQSIEADAATLRKVAEKLNQAAERIRKTTGRAGDSQTLDGFKPIRASYSTTRLPATPLHGFVARVTLKDLALGYIAAALLLYGTGGTVIAGAIALSGLLSILVAALPALLILEIVENYGTQAGRDAIAKCMDQAEARRSRCKSDANSAGLFTIFLYVACDAQWILDAVACQATP